LHGISASELPGVLAAPYADHRSGFLHFRRENERRSIRFRQGHIVYASTNVVEHRLGETLVRQGRISHDNLRSALDVVEQQGALLGPVLLALGYLEANQLSEALEMHARTVIEPLFAWTTGGYEFEPDEGTGTVAHRPRERFTVDLIAAAERQLTERAAGLTTLGDTVKPAPSTARPPTSYDMRDALDRAKTFVAIQNYWEAIQILEAILPRLEERTTRQEAQILLAVAYLKNPKWARRAEGVLQTVVAEDPQNTDALYLLGNLYREKGLDRRAETMLRRVLDIKPNHRLATAALKALRAKK
jgi:tetratricopeptide (TPR) repeat protein